MNRFLLKTSLFLLPLLAVICIISKFADLGLKKTQSGDYAEWNDIYHSSIHADMIVLGSSRAWATISPGILDSTLHLISYNLGIEAHNFFLQEAKYRVYREHNDKPKYIIQALDIFTLDKRPDLIHHEQFIPYLDDTIIVNSTKTYNGFSWADYHVPFVKYTGKKNILETGLKEFFGIKNPERSDYKGYQPHDFPWETDFEQFKEENKNGIKTHLDPNSILLFDHFLSECKKENIEVFLVYPPEYYEVQKLFISRDSIFSMYRNYSSKYGFPWMDFSSDSLCSSREYFYNSMHLNKRGSELFSNHLAEEILKRLK